MQCGIHVELQRRVICNILGEVGRRGATECTYVKMMCPAKGQKHFGVVLVSWFLDSWQLCSRRMAVSPLGRRLTWYEFGDLRLGDECESLRECRDKGRSTEDLAAIASKADP